MSDHAQRASKIRRRTSEHSSSDWPQRPQDEVFPEVMNTIDVAMFLRYDAREGVTPEKGARMVRLLVRDNGLPTLGRVGRCLLFCRSAVLAWLEDRRKGPDPQGAADNVSNGRPVSTEESTAP
jgi:hypothetical protein